MNYLQPYAKSIEYWIQLLQIRLYDCYLKQVLGLNDDNCLCFGKIYRNYITEGAVSGYTPQAFYTGQYLGGDGTNNSGGLFFESGKFILFFAEVENKRDKNGDYCAKVEMLVFADMSIITPNGKQPVISSQRLDEMLLAGLESFIAFNGYGFKVTGTTIDIDKVLERYSGAAKRNALTRNMSNGGNIDSFCALKLNLELMYDPAQV